MLSGPQRKFVEGIVAGLDQTDAYAAAYPKASRKSAMEAASVLSRKLNIKAEIERLKQRVESKFLMTREEWLQEFRDIGKEAREAEDYSAAKGCLREIGLAMPKWYAPEEVTVAGKVTVIIGAAKE